MTHSHSHTHAHEHEYQTEQNIKFAFFLNLAFTLIEIVGGLWTNSMAILSDSVHDLGDSLSLGLAWFLDRYSKRGQDAHFSYGYTRFSLLGALINTIVLIGGSIFVLTEAIPRLINPEPTNAAGMILFALLGISVNGAAMLRLRRSESLNARVVAWHLLEDVLGWVAVLIVSVTLLFVEAPILDPILSILIMLYVLYNVVKTLRETLGLFLQGVPPNVNIEELDNRLRSINYVQTTHHTHVWSMDGVHHILTTHLVVDPCATREETQQIKEEVRHICDDIACLHSTIEIEYTGDECRMAELKH